MTIRHWTARDFVNCDAIKAHRERARDQWFWIGYCQFWLVGLGARGKVRGEPHDELERKIAERERIRHGWEITSIISAYAWATTQDPSGKLKLGECPPTVERDWAEVYLKAEHSPELAKLLAQVGAWPDAQPMPEHASTEPAVEVLVPAGEHYNPDEDPFLEPDADRREW